MRQSSTHERRAESVFSSRANELKEYAKQGRGRMRQCERARPKQNALEGEICAWIDAKSGDVCLLGQMRE